MSWEAVIGLEIHVQLATQSKIFSGAATRYGAEPNAQACAVDLGLPGVLPVLNETAVEMAVTFGLAIGAQINLHSIFDRKNYFYRSTQGLSNQPIRNTHRWPGQDHPESRKR